MRGDPGVQRQLKTLGGTMIASVVGPCDTALHRHRFSSAPSAYAHRRFPGAPTLSTCSLGW
jgi:hypothetical protein